jgi:cob(I)alamin adenosyltransferase
VKIYTRTGDAGETGLFDGRRVSKSDLRVDAYGEVDELNATLGVARATGLLADVDGLCGKVQDALFTLGSALATPPGSKAQSAIPKLRVDWVTEMEQAIDRFDQELPKLTAFILPGGTAQAAALHVARTVCRRAERRVVPLYRAGKVELLAVTYLNRLSDLLFTLARIQNHRANVPDVPWSPQKP